MKTILRKLIRVKRNIKMKNWELGNENFANFVSILKIFR